MRYQRYLAIKSGHNTLFRGGEVPLGTVIEDTLGGLARRTKTPKVEIERLIETGECNRRGFSFDIKEYEEE